MFFFLKKKPAVCALSFWRDGSVADGTVADAQKCSCCLAFQSKA